MKCPRKYRVTIEDESHLRQLATGRFSALGFAAFGLGVLSCGLLVAGMLFAATPLRYVLPGYLKDSQRGATEEGLLRLDSLMEAYRANQVYIDNIMTVYDTGRTPADSAAMQPVSRELNPDSLMASGENERRFVSQMEERERFNISVLAPLAAEGIIFSPVSADAVCTEASRDNAVSEWLLTRESNIQAAADGSIVALYTAPGSRGYVMVLQHARGFLSSYTGTGNPTVEVGDNVNAGQVIAFTPSPDVHGHRTVEVRMWHNGMPIHPFEYLSTPEKRGFPSASSYESPRGT